jgi:hypothetical protein
MKRTIRSAPLVVVLALVAAACGAGDDVAAEGVDTTPTAATETTASTTTTTTTLDVELVPSTTKVPITLPPSEEPVDPNAPVYATGDNPLEFAIADLAYRLGVVEDDVVFISQEEAIWGDGSIGCALPGFSYTQALVDGSRIVLEVDGVTYEYHQAAGRAPFWCANPTG